MLFFFGRQSREQANPAAQFETTLRPHLEAAYNLARWLMKNDSDAEDAVQDACLRALQAFDNFRGENFRGWLLRIVRNTCYTQLKSHVAENRAISFDEELHDIPNDSLNPAAILLRSCDQEQIRQAIADLPTEFREVVVLREMEELSYREIAEIVAIPLGTVMSRLARARQRLESALIDREETKI